MVEIILVHPKIKKNAVNKNGLTVVDTHKQSRKDLTQDKKIWKLLTRANVLPAKEALKTTKDRAWLEDHRTSLMVVASLIATMAFQVGINPPGGVWQDTNVVKDKYGNKVLEYGSNNSTHYAGTSVWSYGHFNYNNVLVSNTIGLISSLSVILLLISGLPCKRHLLSVLRITLWISVTATTLTYMFSVSNLTYGEGGIWAALGISLVAWLGLMGSILVGHFFAIHMEAY
uniref:PGG domain-containing protein n=1 Tax=Chenopodium quinoa TaxID=63459 RepID=A0A803NBX7_CHEQI